MHVKDLYDKKKKKKKKKKKLFENSPSPFNTWKEIWNFHYLSLSLPPHGAGFSKRHLLMQSMEISWGEAMHDASAFGETFLTVGLGWGVKVVEGSNQRGPGPSHMNHSDAHLIEPPTRMVSRPSRSYRPTDLFTQLFWLSIKPFKTRYIYIYI
jgi:hypothetical protein